MQFLHQMFNVYIFLLLDDALNPATPMSIGAINEMQHCGALTKHKVV